MNKYNNLLLFKNIEYTDSLMQYFKVVELSKNDIIFHEKEVQNYFYYLVKGKVSLFSYMSNGKKRIYLTIKDDTLINDYDQTFKSNPYGAIVFEDCILLKIKQERLFALMQSNIQFLKNILFLESHRSRRLYRQLKNTNAINLDKKIAAKLWKYAKDYGVRENNLTLIDFKINNTYLADNIGCSRESVSRSIKKLTNLELVFIENGKYYVDIDALLIFYRSNT